MPNNKLNDLDPKTWLKFQKSWFIHNPPPRKKGVLVHPAKFPETMAQEFIEFFTKTGQTVLDPMCGTGSTLVAALRAGRNSYGIELNPRYAEIARQIISEEKAILAETPDSAGLAAEVITGDALNALDYDIPKVEYVLTSPPYWDMLHAKGAENQKKRRESDGLDVVYSDHPHDLGNIHDYEAFLGLLVNIYSGLKPLLQERAYLTIIVKNVKKGGKIYPLAWDIARELGKVYTLKDEKIWCLPAGQKIWTSSGLKEIEKITKDDFVLTHLGSLEKVTRSMHREHQGKLIRIKPALLGRVVSLTPEHEILTIQRKKYSHKNGVSFHENAKRSLEREPCWIPAQTIEIGDLVAFPIPRTFIDLAEINVSSFMPEVLTWLQDSEWYYTRGRGKHGRGKLPKGIAVNKEFLRLAGWYLSEGNSNKSGVHIANLDSNAQKEIAGLFHSVFGANSQIGSKGVWCRSRSVAQFLMRLFGKDSHTKRLPDFILHLSGEKQADLIQSLWAGDGHIHKNRVRYKTVSEELALGITYLTARAGAVPYIYQNARYLSLDYRGRSMAQMQGLLQIEKTPINSVRDQYWINQEKIWLPVREKDILEYNGTVYNLAVENANSYVTESFVVHNCQDNQRLAPFGLGSAWVSNTFHHYCLQFRNE